MYIEGFVNRSFPVGASAYILHEDVRRVRLVFNDGKCSGKREAGTHGESSRSPLRLSALRHRHYLRQKAKSQNSEYTSANSLEVLKHGQSPFRGIRHQKVKFRLHACRAE